MELASFGAKEGRTPSRPTRSRTRPKKGDKAIGASPIDLSRSGRNDELRQFLAEIVESSEDAILSKNLDGIITSWNRGAEQLFGYAAEEVIGKSVTILIPADRQDEEPNILARLRRGERIEHYETIRRCKDGSLRDISLTVSPIRDSEGVVVGASKIARDITDRRRTAERTNLILQEMQHRTKNLAAVIDGLARLSTPDGQPAVDEFVEVFLGRVHALLSAGELVVTSPIRCADLRQVLETVLEPFAQSNGDSPISLDGPPLPVGERAAGGLALAMHELATNALKFGALTSPGGTIRVHWTVQPEQNRVRIEWKETGGPPVVAEPERTGFGSRLIRSAVSHEPGGSFESAFEPDGLRCRFEFNNRSPDAPG
jgi:PAS domain S-box-containing protein